MAISVDSALDIIYDQTSRNERETIAIEASVGRIASHDYNATFNLPRFDNSAMDGYAVKNSQAGQTLPCNAVIYAGDNPTMTLQTNEVIKIMTGAPIPAGTEAIVPIENVTVKNDSVALPTTIAAGAHIRLAGEDMTEDKHFLSAGDEITPYTLALLASQGFSEIEVYRKIKVAVFSTGSELKHHSQKVEGYQLYNSNSPMFLARAESLGCTIEFMGSIDDRLEEIEQAVASSLDADIIVTSGGVSVGDKDFTKEAFTNLGMTIHFSGIEIKPGKPTTYGTIKDTHIINLPGNPLAAMANFELFVKPLISTLQGRNKRFHCPIATKVNKEVGFKGGRTTIILGTYSGNDFTPIAKQLPGMVSPMSEAEGMIVLAPETDRLTLESELRMIPIMWRFESAEKVEIFT